MSIFAAALQLRHRLPAAAAFVTVFFADASVDADADAAIFHASRACHARRG